jgi:hypothetical protein
MKYKIAIQRRNRTEVQKKFVEAIHFTDAIGIAYTWAHDKLEWEVVEVCKIPEHDANNPFTGTW